MIQYHPIGVIHTPYIELAPFRPDEIAIGVFFLEIDPKLQDALYMLEKFNYLHVLFHVDRAKPYKLRVFPPEPGNLEVGLFASRSPKRPNPIGLSVTKILKIMKNRIYTTGLDVLDNTPLLDIKPYIPAIDRKDQANSGWIEDSM